MITYFEKLTAGITSFSDFICGYPMFLLLIGGGLILFCYSGGVSIRRIGHSMKALTHSGSHGEGQISSFQALMSAIASTVGMGNIAGVAIAITVGGPGAIFWMWIIAFLGMATNYAEAVLAQKTKKITLVRNRNKKIKSYNMLTFYFFIINIDLLNICVYNIDV